MFVNFGGVRAKIGQLYPKPSGHTSYCRQTPL